MPSFLPPRLPVFTAPCGTAHSTQGRASEPPSGSGETWQATGRVSAFGSAQGLFGRTLGLLLGLPYALPVFLENTWRSTAQLIGPNGPRSPDWRSLASRRGIRESLVRDRSGALLAVYTAEIAGVTYVLHSVRKKAWKTGTADIRQAIGHFDTTTKEVIR